MLRCCPLAGVRATKVWPATHQRVGLRRRFRRCHAGSLMPRLPFPCSRGDRRRLRALGCSWCRRSAWEELLGDDAHRDPGRASRAPRASRTAAAPASRTSLGRRVRRTSSLPVGAIPSSTSGASVAGLEQAGVERDRRIQRGESDARAPASAVGSATPRPTTRASARPAEQWTDYASPEARRAPAPRIS